MAQVDHSRRRKRKRERELDDHPLSMCIATQGSPLFTKGAGGPAIMPGFFPTKIIAVIKNKNKNKKIGGPCTRTTMWSEFSHAQAGQGLGCSCTHGTPTTHPEGLPSP
jgi:hypothetical protein